MKIDLFIDVYGCLTQDHYITADNKPTMPKPDGVTRYKIEVDIPMDEDVDLGVIKATEEKDEEPD